jgi:hypothetical protein
VIFLEGGRDTFGPKAAELTGAFYRAMFDRNYFLQSKPETTALVGSGSGTQQ